MITLKELLHSIRAENEEGLINVDDWRWPDLDHLITMGFDFQDDYRMTSKKGTTEDGNEKITIYRKKDKDDKGKQEKFFFVEEPKRGVKRFKNFNDIIDYFDTYSQPEIDKNV